MEASNLTKKEAAREQLETAIQIFFYSGPKSAVHTLAAASLALSRDPLHGRGETYTLDIEKWVRPEKKAEWRRIANRQANFLKHADRDSDAVLVFNEEQTKYQVLESIDAYHTLYADLTLPMKVYQIWFARSYPDFFQGEGWQAMCRQLREEGFDPTEFTTEFCGDLLFMVALQRSEEFSSRCRRLLCNGDLSDTSKPSSTDTR